MAGKNTVEIILSAKDEASNALKEAFGSVEESNNRLVGSILSAKALIAGAFGALGGYIAKTGVDYNAMVESSTVAWNTLLGSQDKAKKMLQDISTFAKNTQFGTEDVDQMAKYMFNAGYAGKQLFDSLNKIADVAGAFNIPAESAKEMTRQMSQVIQSGTAYTQDLNILQDRGVPIYKAIAKELHTTTGEVKNMASNGKLTADIYMKAFNDVANSVKGASDAQAQTFTGMISTLKDDWDILAGALSKPLFNLLKKGLTDLLPIMDSFSALAKGDFQGVSDSIGKAFGPNAAKMVTDFTKGFKEGFANGFDEMMTKSGTVGAFIGNTFFLAEKTITDFKTRFKEGTQAIIDFLKGDNIGGISLLTKMGLSPKAVVEVSTTLISIHDYIAGFVQGVQKTFSQLFSEKNNLGGSFTQVFQTIQSVAMPILGDVVQFVKDSVAKIKGFWDQDGSKITQSVKDEVKLIADGFTKLKPVLQAVWDSVKTVGTVAFNLFIDATKFLGDKMNWVMPILTGVAAAIGTFKIINTIIDLYKSWQIVTTLMTAAQTALDVVLNANPIGLVAIAVGALIAAGVALYQNWDTVSAKMSSIWTSIEQGASKFVNSIIGGINWMIQQINKLPGVNIPLIGQVSWGGTGSGTTFQTAQAQSHNHGQAYAYANGTDGHPGGPAIVGDGIGINAGSELFMLPNGRIGLTPSTPTVMDLPKGTQVVNAKDTKNLLKGLIPAYAFGIGSFGDWLKGKIEGIKDMAINNVLGGSALGIFSSLPKALMSLTSSGLYDNLKQTIGGWFGGGDNESGNVMDWLQKAIQLTGVPSSWLGPLSTIAQHESGGNPAAENHWDSNQKYGGTFGLMQMILPTFQQYAAKGLNNILDPVANAAASINYIKSRYGDIFNVPGIKSMMGGGSYVGYAGGTDDAPGGFAMIGENGPELMYVPRHAQIKTNHETKQLLNPKGGNTYNLKVINNQNMSEMDLIRMFQRLEALN